MGGLSFPPTILISFNYIKKEVMDMEKKRRLESNRNSIEYILVKPRMYGYLLLGWALFWIVILLVGILLSIDPGMPGGY